MIRSVLAVTEAERREAFASRAWLDDVEVTNDCQVADDEAGRVLLLKRDGVGRFIRDADGDPVTEWHYGRVRIEAKA